MNELLDDDFEASIRAALAHDSERAPRAPQWAGPNATVASPRSSLHWVTVAASVIVVAVLGAVAFLVTRSDDPVTIDGAPTPETTIATSSTDPQWTPMAAPSIAPRSGYVSVPTDDGWFVWGGWTGSIAEGESQSLNDGAYYDGVSDTWTTLPEAPITNDFTAAYGVWTGIEVIVVVAYGEPQLAAFDPVTFTWREIPVSDDLRAAWPQPDGHFARGLHRFIAGKLVMFFPNSSTGAPALLLVDPATGDSATGATPPITPDDGTSGVAASSGQLFVAGMGQRGSDGVCSGDSTPLFIYDVATDTWNTSFLPHGNWQPAVVAWTGSGLLAGGGLICGAQTVMRTASLFDPITSTWTDVSDMTDDLWYSLVEPVVSEGRVIVAGESGRPSVYYPELDAWWSGPALFAGRPFGDLHLAALGGRVMVWSASPLEPQDDGSFSCCTPDPAARALAIPTDPPEASPTPATTLVPTATLIASDSCTTGVYALVQGDSPFAVATKFDITVDELTAANLTTPGFAAFAVGTRVVIPPSRSSGCRVAIVVQLNPTASVEQVALVRNAIDALDLPISSATTSAVEGPDGSVRFHLYALDPVPDQAALESIAAALRSLPMVVQVDVAPTQSP